MISNGFVFKVFIGTTMLVSAITALSISKKEPVDYKVIVSNKENFDRINEVAVVNNISIGRFDDSLSLSVTGHKNKVLITQEIDRNNDGVWDELLIEIRIKAHSTDTLHLRMANQANRKVFVKTTNVRLSLRSDTHEPSAELNYDRHVRGFTQNIAKPFYQMEVPGIENNKVAFWKNKGPRTVSF